MIEYEPACTHENTAKAEGDKWEVCFSCKADWEAIRAHVEQCLRPLKYDECYWKTPTRGSSRERVTTYYSPDRITRIALKREKDEFIGNGEWLYELEAVVHVEPTIWDIYEGGQLMECIYEPL